MPTRMFAAVMAVFLCSAPALSLGFPIPQPKPCKTYFDGAYWHKKIANDPRTLAYIATPDFIIAKSKQGPGILIKPSKKGCLIIERLTALQVDKLLTDQEDS
jgi:hypothetical protein